MKVCGIIDTDNDKKYPTLAGTIIFGKFPQSYYPQLFVACSVIPGVNLGDVGEFGERFVDNKRIEGTLEEMLEGTMNFLRRNMKTMVIIDSDGKRSDRIEVISPGALYGPNRLEKLGTATMLESRNPTIVRILEEKSSVIENRHTGILTMKREMKNYGLVPPEFEVGRDCFKVIFRNTIEISFRRRHSFWNKESLSETKFIEGGQVSGQVNTSVQIINQRNKVLEFCKQPRTTKEIQSVIKGSE